MNEQERMGNFLRNKLFRIKTDFGLNESLWGKYRLENFKVTPENKQAFKIALNYIPLMDNLKTPHENFKTEQEVEAWWDNTHLPHFFLTFLGPCGRGKTHLALGIGIALIEKYENHVIYYQVPQLLNLLRSAYRADSELNPYEILDKCRYVECLILDDLGMQKNTDWAIEQLDSLIDSRYLTERNTIFTSNLVPGDLGSDRISSRIQEGDIAILGGPDYRKTIAQERKDKRELQKFSQDLHDISKKQVNK